jgi:predicted P-loop ATPase
VNHATYLKDDTGNRRYLPVTLGYIALDELAADRDQLWAEALSEYLKGTVWWIRAAEAAIFEAEQDQRYIGDAYEDRILAWLDEVDIDGNRDQVTTGQLLGHALKLEISKWTLPEQQRVGRIMARLPDWVRERKGGRESREWVYVRRKGANG